MNVIYKTVSGEDMRVHTCRQSSVALAGRMLITQRDIDVAVPATVKQLGKRGALLREDREARMPQIVELKPRNTSVHSGPLPGSTQAIRVQG